MKKFIALFISFLSILGCAEITDCTVNKNDVEILFNTNGEKGSKTRAIVTNEMVDNFGVYGYVVPGTFSEQGGYLMKNAEYEENGTAANGEHYYWPKSQNNTNIDVIFTAYSQFTQTPTFNAETGELTLTMQELSQALINDPSDFNDVLWAQSEIVNHQNADVDATHYSVPLKFSHALSWLSFRAEVAENTAIKYAKIKQVKFCKTETTDPIPAVYDTTDTWFNLKRGSNCDGSPTKTSTDGGATYVDNYEIPAALVAEIKSYYSINNGTAGDYDLHMGNSVWPSAEIRQLRVVKDVPAEYKLPVETNSGDVIVFFDALKYLEDNGYKMAPKNTGGKPAIFDYPIIDLFVNGSAYTIVGFNFGVSTVYDASVAANVSALNFTIEEVSPETPGSTVIVDDGVYTAGTMVLPTKTLVTETPSVVYSGEKNSTFDYAPNDDIINGTSYDEPHDVTLCNVLVIPQTVPEYITFVFDICILNATGDEVLFTDRQITRKINEGKDADNAHTYVSSWLASHKYVYNFKVNVEAIDFNVSVNGWETNDHEYHVWDN